MKKLIVVLAVLALAVPAFAFYDPPARVSGESWTSYENRSADYDAEYSRQQEMIRNQQFQIEQQQRQIDELKKKQKDPGSW